MAIVLYKQLVFRFHEYFGPGICDSVGNLELLYSILYYSRIVTRKQVVPSTLHDDVECNSNRLILSRLFFCGSRGHSTTHSNTCVLRQGAQALDLALQRLGGVVVLILHRRLLPILAHQRRHAAFRFRAGGSGANRRASNSRRRRPVCRSLAA